LTKLSLLFLRIPGWSFARVRDDEQNLVGVCQFCRVSQEIAVLEHLFVDEERRKSGFGSALLGAVERSLFDDGVKVIIAEMNDHHLMTEEEIAGDSTDPEERYIFWTKMGYRTVDAPYRQPPLVDFTPTARERELIGPVDEETEEAESGEPSGTVDYLA